MSSGETIRLLNTNKNMPVTVYSFDNDSIDLPANQTEPSEVDAKFNWNLPRGVKNLTPPAKVEANETTPDNPKPVSVKPNSNTTPLKN